MAGSRNTSQKTLCYDQVDILKANSKSESLKNPLAPKYKAPVKNIYKKDNTKYDLFK